MWQSGKQNLISSDQDSARKIEEFFLEQQLLSRDQILIAGIEAQSSNRSVEQVLLELGFLTDQQLALFFQDVHRLNTVDLANIILEREVIQLIPKKMSEKLKVVPFYLKGREVGVAMEDPTHLLVLDELRQHFESRLIVKPYFSKESSIVEAIEHYYDHSLSVSEILEELAKEVSAHDKNPIIRLFQALLVEGTHKNASDIHFEPDEKYVRIRFRIDGILHNSWAIHKNFWEALLVHIKVVSGMNIAESRLPQSGRFSRIIMHRSLDFRLSTHPTHQGESIVVRILDQTVSMGSLEELNFPSDIVTTLRRVLKRPEGLIIVTGPTGSGKTTTLYALLNEISSSDVNIMTLEQPIEYTLPGIRQTEIKETGGMTFAEGIRSILRQDPDVIFVGEVRDDDTAQMACRAAMTGHQVYTTLHAPNVFGVMQRMADLNVPYSFLGSNLIAVVAQRLVRRLCPKCKKKRLLSDAERSVLGESSKPIQFVYDSVGCGYCFNMGYKGRTPIIELLECSEEINHSIAHKLNPLDLGQRASFREFKSLQKQALKAVQDGETSVEEILIHIDFAK